MLHLYWSESKSDVAWNGLLLFYAAYLHWSESEITSNVAPKWVATHSGAMSLAMFGFRFRSNIIAPLLLLQDGLSVGTTREKRENRNR